MGAIRSSSCKKSGGFLVVRAPQARGGRDVGDHEIPVDGRGYAFGQHPFDHGFGNVSET